MKIYVNGSQTKVLFEDVHVVPGPRKNLLSIGQLAMKGIHTLFTKQRASLYNLTTRESNNLLAAPRGTRDFATLMGMQSFQLFRRSQQNLTTAS